MCLAVAAGGGGGAGGAGGAEPGQDAEGHPAQAGQGPHGGGRGGLQPGLERPGDWEDVRPPGGEARDHREETHPHVHPQVSLEAFQTKSITLSTWNNHMLWHRTFSVF